MKQFFRFAAFAGLVWTVIVLAFVLFKNTRENDLSRQLRALAGVHLGAAPEDMTNEVIRIPRESVDIVKNLSYDAHRQTDDFSVALLLSAATTAVLSVLLFVSAKRQREAHAHEHG